jgi:hypothetical protein
MLLMVAIGQLLLVTDAVPPQRRLGARPRDTPTSVATVGRHVSESCVLGPSRVHRNEAMDRVLLGASGP